jgi:hypothetical protein
MMLPKNNIKDKLKKKQLLKQEKQRGNHFISILSWNGIIDFTSELAHVEIIIESLHIK